MGRAYPFCPGTSDLSLFRYRERVIHLDAEISDRALDLGVTEQELDRPQVAGAPVDQGSLRPPQRVGTGVISAIWAAAWQARLSWRGVIGCAGSRPGNS